jgi:hypothetical protein
LSVEENPEVIQQIQNGKSKKKKSGRVSEIWSRKIYYSRFGKTTKLVRMNRSDRESSQFERLNDVLSMMGSLSGLNNTAVTKYH